MSMTNTWGGLYKGIVEDNQDPENYGRLRLQIPQVLGNAITDWAWPGLTAVAGAQISIPAIGSGVWVMFEGGDPDFPVWVGTWQLGGNTVITGVLPPTPALSTPSPPQNFSAVAHDGFATLSWSPSVTLAGQAVVTSYTITSTPGAPASPLTTASASIHSVTFSSLTNGVQYEFAVTANSDSGPSQPVLSDIITPSGKPLAWPATPTAAVKSATSATVGWSIPPNNGSQILYYLITASPGGGTVQEFGESNTSAIFNGLSSSQSYTFTVQAFNANGSGPVSGATNSVTPTSTHVPPDPPTNVTAVASTSGSAQATVSFAAPTNIGTGTPPLSYTVTSNPGGLTSTGTSLSQVVTGLTYGTTYTFTVTATGDGTSVASAASNAVVPSKVPDAPTGLQLGVSSGQLTIFGFSVTNNGSPITQYTATASPGGAVGTSLGSPPTNSVTVTGLTNGTSYTISLTATNADGVGAAATINGTPSAGIAFPTTVQATTTMQAVSISLGAEPLPANVGMTTTMYDTTSLTITAQNNTQSATVSPAVPLSTGVSMPVPSGIQTGANLSLTSTAIAATTTMYDTTQSSLGLVTMPGAATSVTTSNITSSTITINWVDPTTGTAPFTYVVVSSNVSTTSSSSSQNLTSSTTTINVVNGGAVHFAPSGNIRVMTSTGNQILAYTGIAAVGGVAATQFTGVSGGTTATIAAGASVVQVSAILPDGTTSYTFVNLEPNTPYSFLVNSRNSAGVKGSSAVAATTLQQTSTPTRSIRVGWAANQPGGGTVTTSNISFFDHIQVQPGRLSGSGTTDAKLAALIAAYGAKSPPTRIYMYYKGSHLDPTEYAGIFSSTDPGAGNQGGVTGQGYFEYDTSANIVGVNSGASFTPLINPRSTNFQADRAQICVNEMNGVNATSGRYSGLNPDASTHWSGVFLDVLGTDAPSAAKPNGASTRVSYPVVNGVSSSTATRYDTAHNSLWYTDMGAGAAAIVSQISSGLIGTGGAGPGAAPYTQATTVGAGRTINVNMIGVNGEGWRSSGARDDWKVYPTSTFYTTNASGAPGAAKIIGPGYIRMPGGTTVNYYDWRTGKFIMDGSTNESISAGGPGTNDPMFMTGSYTGSAGAIGGANSWMQAAISIQCEPLIQLNMCSLSAGAISAWNTANPGNTIPTAGANPGRWIRMDTTAHYQVDIQALMADQMVMLDYVVGWMQNQTGYSTWTPKYIELGNELYLTGANAVSASNTYSNNSPSLTANAGAYVYACQQALAGIRAKSWGSTVQVAVCGLLQKNHGLNSAWMSALTGDSTANGHINATDGSGCDGYTFHGMYFGTDYPTLDLNDTSFAAWYGVIGGMINVYQTDNAFVTTGNPASVNVLPAGKQAWYTEWNFHTPADAGHWSWGLALTAYCMATHLPDVDVGITGPHAFTANTMNMIQQSGSTYSPAGWGAAFQVLYAAANDQTKFKPLTFSTNPTQTTVGTTNVGIFYGGWWQGPTNTTCCIVNLDNASHTVQLPAEFATGSTVTSICNSGSSLTAVNTYSTTTPTVDATGTVTLPALSIASFTVANPATTLDKFSVIGNGISAGNWSIAKNLFLPNGIPMMMEENFMQSGGSLSTLASLHIPVIQAATSLPGTPSVPSSAANCCVWYGLAKVWNGAPNNPWFIIALIMVAHNGFDSSVLAFEIDSGNSQGWYGFPLTSGGTSHAFTELAIGDPVGAPSTMVTSGGVYGREYTFGYVICNPNTSATNFTLPTSNTISYQDFFGTATYTGGQTISIPGAQTGSAIAEGFGGYLFLKRTN